VSTTSRPRILVIANRTASTLPEPDAPIPDPVRDAMPNTAHIPPIPGGGGEF
jgi:hypothetical protein